MKNKFYMGLVLAGAGLLAQQSTVQAQTYSTNGFTFTTKNGVATITHYSGAGGVVSIPGTVFVNGVGLPVTSISGFGGPPYNSMDVLIPDTVTNIGNSAFASCNVAEITIGSNVISIGHDAFSSCVQLYNVTIPDSVVSLGFDVFGYCSSLAEITIGAGVTNVISGLSGLFVNCWNLTMINVDASNRAYSSVDGVVFDKNQTTLVSCPPGTKGSYSIPNGVLNIGADAFFSCFNLTNITFSAGVTNIIISQENAFSDCLNLQSITVDASNSAHSSADGVLFDKKQTTLLDFPGRKGGNYSVPKSVVNIGDFAFIGCEILTNVTMSDGVAEFGDAAFGDCEKLVNLTIPSSLASIGNSAFYNCTSLTNLTLPSSVTSIGGDAFYNCASLTNLYFLGNAPSGIAWIFGSDYTVGGYTNTTVYYLPGTTGWITNYYDFLTALWYLPNPFILDGQTSFGVQTNQFGFTISWATNASVVVEASTNLFNPVWLPVQTNTLNGGTAYFSDPEWTYFASRFYRLRSP